MLRYAAKPSSHAPVTAGLIGEVRDYQEPPLVERMARKMREMGMNNVPVTAESLFEHSDFTRAEIEEHAREAADLARSQAVRRVA